MVGSENGMKKNMDNQQYLITCEGLKELFPVYAEEIAQLKKDLYLCGCASCVWNGLKLRHPELKLPEPRKDYILF
ncbi:unnamed protein product [marine sediment metagenome]|uniref:Uncharacterized protein n=1 Tax=marine sediment metagenome TaxID=412755 RepID=X1A5Z0_9ZZZZ